MDGEWGTRILLFAGIAGGAKGTRDQSRKQAKGDSDGTFG